MQVAANVGNSGKPGFGQRDVRERRQRDNFAGVGQVKQPLVSACLNAEKAGRSLAAGTGEARRQVGLKLAEADLLGHGLGAG
jgi:hypothetical protein